MTSNIFNNSLNIDFLNHNNFLELRFCDKCSYVCNLSNIRYLNNVAYCNKCYKYTLKKSKKINIGLGNISYISRGKQLHTGCILTNTNIYYNDRIFNTSIEWINYLDSL